MLLKIVGQTLQARCPVVNWKFRPGNKRSTGKRQFSLKCCRVVTGTNPNISLVLAGFTEAWALGPGSTANCTCALDQSAMADDNVSSVGMSARSTPSELTRSRP